LQQRQLVFCIIVVAQFCGTSLWFVGNAVLPQWQLTYHWPPTALGFLVSATQLGFILGTLVFAATGLTDRFSPSKLFFTCSIIAGSINLLVLLDMSSYSLVILSRGVVGFFLAGIYPVGMKIAADWSEAGLNKWLGALVGALIIGTAFPHGLKLFPLLVEAKYLLLGTSLLSVTGGVLLLFFVPDGPYRKPASSFRFSGIRKIFDLASFRRPALAYFGHMWELYAFWVFVPWICMHYLKVHSMPVHPSLLAFFIIAFGSLGCVIGGQWSSRIGSRDVAKYALIGSALCCLLSPFVLSLPPSLFTMFMLFWGITAAADSPQLSALVAVNAPAEFRGSAITLVVCIGFSITIASIQLLNFLQDWFLQRYLLLLLAPGPIAGVIALRTKT
jgi:MFS family permease